MRSSRDVPAAWELLPKVDFAASVSASRVAKCAALAAGDNPFPVFEAFAARSFVSSFVSLRILERDGGASSRVGCAAGGSTDGAAGVGGAASVAPGCVAVC